MTDICKIEQRWERFALALHVGTEGNGVRTLLGPGGEFWRVKGGDRGIPRLLCCLCHVLYGLPTDGWTVAPDGRTVMAAAIAIGEGA